MSPARLRHSETKLAVSKLLLCLQMNFGYWMRRNITSTMPRALRMYGVLGEQRRDSFHYSDPHMTRARHDHVIPFVTPPTTTLWCCAAGLRADRGGLFDGARAHHGHDHIRSVGPSLHDPASPLIPHPTSLHLIIYPLDEGGRI